MKTYSRRDLTVVSGFDNNGSCLVIACDSCGSVGEKETDTLKLPAKYTSKFAARVALTEVICSGASPITITNGASNEMTPTGEELIKGIKEELANAQITGIALTGSTEENFPTNMTAVAVTVIGIAKEDELNFKQATNGDVVIQIGIPQAGKEVDLESVGFYKEIRQFLSLPGVREIVPVGSKGITYEANTLATLNNMDMHFEKQTSPTQIYINLPAQQHAYWCCVRRNRRGMC